MAGIEAEKNLQPFLPVLVYSQLKSGNISRHNLGLEEHFTYL